MTASWTLVFYVGTALLAGPLCFLFACLGLFTGRISQRTDSLTLVLLIAGMAQFADMHTMEERCNWERDLGDYLLREHGIGKPDKAKYQYLMPLRPFFSMHEIMEEIHVTIDFDATESTYTGAHKAKKAKFANARKKRGEIRRSLVAKMVGQKRETLARQQRARTSGTSMPSFLCILASCFDFQFVLCVLHSYRLL